MKKGKKILSIILAALILMSSLSAVLTSSALDAGSDQRIQAVSDIVAEFSAYKNNIGAACPTITVGEDDAKYQTQLANVNSYKAKVEIYSKLIPAYKDLTQAEKNAFPVTDALVILKAVVEREAYLIKAEYDGNLPEGSPASEQMTSVDSRKRAQAKLDEYVGTHAARDEAYELFIKHFATPFTGSIKLSANVDFNKYPQAEDALNAFLADYGKASALARKYMDGMSSGFMSYGMLSYGATFSTTVSMLTRLEMSKNPYTGTRPTPAVGKPKEANYPEGKNDPAYIADLEAYLKYAKASQEYSTGMYNYEAGINIASLEKVIALAPEFSEAISVMKALRSAYISFVETGSVDGCKAAMTSYDALGVYEQASAKISAKAYSYYWLADSKESYMYSNLSFSQLYNKCEETGAMALIEEFVEYIDGVNLTEVTNEVVAQAMTVYSKIPFSFRTKVPVQAKEKYDAVLALYVPIAPMTPSGYGFSAEIAAFEKAAIAYSCNDITDKQLNRALASVEDIAGSVISSVLGGDLEAYIENNLYTNSAMSSLVSLYKRLVNANIEASGINISSIFSDRVSPQKLAGYLAEDKFAGAREKIAASGSIDNYDAIAFSSGDWGFEDGDKNGFANAAAALLRPVGDLLNNGALFLSSIIILPNSKASNGDHIYGGYEPLIPMLESLGLKGVLSSEDYTRQYREAFSDSANNGYDALFLPVIKPVLGLLDEIAANPVDRIMQLLADIAVTLTDDKISKAVNGMLDTNGLLSGVEVRLDATAVNNLLANALSSLKVGGNTYSITLSPVDWATLARCGELKTAKSVSASNAYRTAMEADKGDVFYLLYHYLFKNLLGNEKNAEQINALIADNTDGFAAAFARILIGVVTKVGAKDSLCGLLLHLHSPGISKISGIALAVFSFIKKLINAVKALFS